MFHYFLEDGIYTIFARKDDYLAEKTKETLPYDGWYQNCILCYNITSQIKEYTYLP